MNRTLPTFLALSALTLSSAVGAIDRSHSFVVVQNATQDAWIATCTLDAKDIDWTQTYYGQLQVWYGDDQGSDTTLANVPFVLSPTAKQFKDESPGIYKASGRLSKGSIHITIEVSRYGPLTVYDYTSYKQAAGSFGCRANVIMETGTFPDTLIHSIEGSQRVTFYF